MIFAQSIMISQSMHTYVSLNTIMVDGTGMCGGCRAVVDDQTVFVCVDGPEFDAHKVDFDILMQRNRTYRSQESISLEEFHKCRNDVAFEEGLRRQALAPEVSHG